jgi:hypothetical protein
MAVVPVIPEKAGIQSRSQKSLDARFRGHDGNFAL